VLRRSRITGWVTNHPVWLEGRRRYLDIAFVSRRVVIEFDGRMNHGPAQFEDDRQRQNALVKDGWRVLRITWRMLEDPARLLALVRGVLALT